MDDSVHVLLSGTVEHIVEPQFIEAFRELSGPLCIVVLGGVVVETHHRRLEVSFKS